MASLQIRDFRLPVERKHMNHSPQGQFHFQEGKFLLSTELLRIQVMLCDSESSPGPHAEFHGPNPAPQARRTRISVFETRPIYDVHFTATEGDPSVRFLVLSGLTTMERARSRQNSHFGIFQQFTIRAASPQSTFISVVVLV
jgi:hypothetical protein